MSEITIREEFGQEELSVAEVWSETEIEARVKVPYPVALTDKIMACVMFVLAYLAVDTFSFSLSPQWYGVGVTVFILFYGIAILAYARHLGQKIGKEGVFWFAIMELSGLSYALIYNSTLMVFHGVFLRTVLLYFTAAVFGSLMTGRTSGYVLFDGINALLMIPCQNLKAMGTVIGENFSRYKAAGTLLRALLGLVAAIPLFGVIVSLLASADREFAHIITRLFEIGWEKFFDQIWVLFLAIPVSCYLFGLAYGAAHQRKTENFKKDKIDHLLAVCGVIPRASIYAVLIGICLLYLLFIGVQGKYYLSALQGILPSGFTYSEYARSGFFELVTVSIINLCLIGATELLVKKQEKKDKKDVLLRCSNVILSVLTLFLIATAMTKMALYIKVYGLTPLRVVPSVFMVFLAIVFLLIVICQFRTVPVARIGVFAFAVSYVVLSLANMDGRIARYNLARYQAGTLDEIPQWTLVDGSLASVPAIYDFWMTTTNQNDKEELERIAARITDWDDGAIYSSQHSWKYRNRTKDLAVKELNEMLQNEIR